MTLRPLSDMSPADWFVNSDAPLALRASLGPPGFEAYARLLHTECNAGQGGRVEGHLDDTLLTALCENLAPRTTTPDDCYFGLWEGYGDIHGGEAAGFLTTFIGPPRWPGRIFRREKPPVPPPPAFPPHVMNGPLLGANNAEHFLFGGSIDEAGEWGAADYALGLPRGLNSPNLMWPVDHSWFVTTNIDRTWTGVAGTTALIDDLLRDPRLEVVRSRYDIEAAR
ncbi:MAG: hypothetical protein M3Q98_16210 [Actinomycetota bacterium]|nr:hypothetical protein [Actinomycetota bacterium]